MVVSHELPGNDLIKAVVDGMGRADLFVVMGTQTYGKKTSGIIDTSKEMQEINHSKKPFFLINPLTWIGVIGN